MNLQYGCDVRVQTHPKYFGAGFGLSAQFAMTVLMTSVATFLETAVSLATPNRPALPTSTAKSVRLIPFRDPYPMAQPRFWDIADRPYSAAFRRSFSYARANVVLRYEPMMTTKYFRGYLSARGLKPNFAYQMKLCGKPRDGVRGWKKWSDDISNERIGRAARWWDDTAGRNATDWDFDDNQNTSAGARHTIYGYHFLGDFITDERGEAEVEIEGRHSYHITWQDHQYGAKDVVAGTYSVGSTLAPHYAYGQRVEPTLMKLWYEWEVGRSQQVELPRGTYNCRVLITEETFHNRQGGTNDDGGGYWTTVLASEDFDRTGHPDTNSHNDIVFTIR